jgi:hypothetical protein
VSESYKRRYALECMRLAAECMQLAGDVESPTLQAHFLRMAEIWPSLAEQGPAHMRDEGLTRRVYPAHGRMTYH